MDQLFKILTGQAVLLNNNPKATLAILVKLNGNYWDNKIGFVEEGLDLFLLWKDEKPFCWISLDHYIMNMNNHIPFIEASEIAYKNNLFFT